MGIPAVPSLSLVAGRSVAFSRHFGSRPQDLSTKCQCRARLAVLGIDLNPNLPGHSQLYHQDVHHSEMSATGNHEHSDDIGSESKSQVVVSKGLADSVHITRSLEICQLISSSILLH